MKGCPLLVVGGSLMRTGFGETWDSTLASTMSVSYSNELVPCANILPRTYSLSRHFMLGGIKRARQQFPTLAAQLFPACRCLYWNKPKV